MKLDPILVVQNVEESAKWYQEIFGCRSMHGGNEFEILVSKDDSVLICLHKWGAHDHPTMKKPGITPGNGFILYIRTENMDEIYQNAERMGYAVEEAIHMNPNSGKKEFSLRDPDGYYLIITEFHQYKG
jgi:uncharacterized glyoxalase superfamily protein PhnB